MSRRAPRTLVLASQPALCEVCGGSRTVKCHIPEPPGEWPWPRFVSCPHCTYPWIPILTYRKRSA